MSLSPTPPGLPCFVQLCMGVRTVYSLLGGDSVIKHENVRGAGVKREVYIQTSLLSHLPSNLPPCFTHETLQRSQI